MKYRIHVGAHKTATTHLQSILSALAPALLEDGKRVLPLSALRLTQLSRLLKTDFLHQKLLLPIRRKKWDSLVSSERLPYDTTVMSEEKLLGGVDDALAAIIYPNAAERLRMLCKVIGEENPHLFLSIRNQGSFLPSAYSQYLRGLRRETAFDAILERVIKTPPSWVDLIRRIKSALPTARLSIWTFENYSKDNTHMISALCGVERLDVPSIEIPRETQRLSASIIKNLEMIGRKASRRQKRREISEIFNKAQAGEPEKFDPLTFEQKAYLTSYYEHELEEIRSIWPNILIEPT